MHVSTEYPLRNACEFLLIGDSFNAVASICHKTSFSKVFNIKLLIDKGRKLLL